MATQKNASIAKAQKSFHMGKEDDIARHANAHLVDLRT